MSTNDDKRNLNLDARDLWILTLLLCYVVVNLVCAGPGRPSMSAIGLFALLSLVGLLLSNGLVVFHVVRARVAFAFAAIMLLTLVLNVWLLLKASASV